MDIGLLALPVHLENIYELKGMERELIFVVMKSVLAMRFSLSRPGSAQDDSNAPDIR